MLYFCLTKTKTKLVGYFCFKGNDVPLGLAQTQIDEDLPSKVPVILRGATEDSLDGSDGPDGPDGPDGTDGTDGPDGPDGPNDPDLPLKAPLTLQGSN